MYVVACLVVPKNKLLLQLVETLGAAGLPFSLYVQPHAFKKQKIEEVVGLRGSQAALQ